MPKVIYLTHFKYPLGGVVGYKGEYLGTIEGRGEFNFGQCQYYIKNAEGEYKWYKESTLDICLGTIEEKS